MLPPRILGLLVILLAVQGLCKPTDEEDYEDDPPFDEDEDEEEEEADADNLGVADATPQILSTPISIRILAGSTALLPCNVIHTENYAVTWMKDNDYLYIDSQPHTPEQNRIVRFANNSLMIYNASVSDSSNNYQCIILRQHNNIVLTHRLLVEPERSQKPPPTVPSQQSHKGIIRVTPSRKVEVKQGQSIKLGCETDRRPPPEMKWFIENEKLGGDNPDVILSGNYITIRKVNKTHSGLYQCLAEDGSSKPAMEAITVLVHYLPEIEVKRNVVHSGTGITSELTCIVNAYPEAIIQWYKDNKEVTQKKGLLTLNHEKIKGNRTKHTLRIIHTSARDFGGYECVAENSIGQGFRRINLTGAPSQAKIFGAEMTSDDAAIVLKWRLESYSPISEYKLQYRRKGEEEWNFVEPEVKDGKGNLFIVEHPIEKLQPGSYEAILTARNAFGWSQPSEPHMFNGDYLPNMAQTEENSAAIQIRPPGTLLLLILVVLSCAFTSL